MEVKIENKKEILGAGSELRQDIVTGDWVIIATARAKRPDDFVQRNRIQESNEVDLFADPEKSGQEKDVLIYSDDAGEWTLRVFPNKYPAVSRGRKARSLGEGPYFAMTGVGYHEVIVTRDPMRHLALLDQYQVAEVLDAYQERYLALMNKESVNYIQIFHNHGKEAGASIAHPHSQLMAIPVIAPYVESMLGGAENFYKSHRERVYSMMTEYELSHQKRLIYENDDFIVFVPYAPRMAFELWVIGKRPNPYFERMTDTEKFTCADALQKALQSLYKGLANPAYRFYLYTAPCNGRDYPHFQWSIQILPHTSVFGGFEFSTGIEISTIEPEQAAQFLRKQLDQA